MKIPRFESFVWGSECGCSVAVGAGPHPTNNSGLGMVFLTKKEVTLRSVPNVSVGNQRFFRANFENQPHRVTSREAKRRKRALWYGSTFSDWKVIYFLSFQLLRSGQANLQYHAGST